jgi:hypothetical protein
MGVKTKQTGEKPAALVFCPIRHYAICQKVAGSRPDMVNEFVSICLILPAALGPGAHSASNRNKKQKNNVSGEQSTASSTSHNPIGFHGLLQG